MIDSCDTCRFARPTISDNPNEGPILKCHRHPPIIINLDGDVVQTNPDAGDWCGEYDRSDQ